MSIHSATGYDVDLAVIGSGGAAMAAGITARRAGASVVLIERGQLGGTCVNVGCVPSKMLLAAAGTRHATQTNPFDGVPTDAGPAQLAALMTQKDRLLARLRQSKYAAVADAWGFAVRAGTAGFRDPETLEVDGQPLRARGYLVATGAQPQLSGVAGLEHIDYLTSTTAMEQTRLPESLAVIGGGYVGMEQAQLFAHLGSRVTLIGRAAPYAEPELAAILAEVFAEDGISIVEEHARAVRPNPGGGLTVTTSSGQQVCADRLLLATGRRPDHAALNLPAAGVDTDEAGFIAVDEQQRTSNPRVFAAGDVAGHPQHVYVAAATGRVAATNALDPTAAMSVDYTGLPSVTFTRPQLASAGLSEQQALAAGHRCDCRVLPLRDVPRALVDHDTRGAVKLVAAADTGRVLGVHAAAAAAGELMLAATYAIKTGLTVDDLADTWAPYLTMSESLRIVAGLFRGQTPTSCCA